MNTLMYRGASQQVKNTKVNSESKKTYRGAFYKRLPKQERKESLHTYRGVEFSSQYYGGNAMFPFFIAYK